MDEPDLYCHRIFSFLPKCIKPFRIIEDYFESKCNKRAMFNMVMISRLIFMNYGTSVTEQHWYKFNMTHNPFNSLDI